MKDIDAEQRLPVIMFGSKEQLKNWAKDHEEELDDLMYEAGMTRFFQETGLAVIRLAEFIGSPVSDPNAEILAQVEERLARETEPEVKAIIVKVRRNLEVLQCMSRG